MGSHIFVDSMKEEWHENERKLKQLSEDRWENRWKGASKDGKQEKKWEKLQNNQVRLRERLHDRGIKANSNYCPNYKLSQSTIEDLCDMVMGPKREYESFEY